MPSKTIIRQLPPPPPTFDETLCRWNLWSDLGNVKAIVIGLLYADSKLGTNKLAAILYARNPSVYGTMTSREVEFIFSWLRKNIDVPSHPYKEVFHMCDEDDDSSNVYASMRTFIWLGLLESEGGILGARMRTLKAAAMTLKKMEAIFNDIKKEERRETRQKKDLAEKFKEMDIQRVKTDKKKEQGAGTDEE